MKKNYTILVVILTLCASLSAQTVLFDQPSIGGNGIVSDVFTDIPGAVYSTDDFELTSTSRVEEITAYGFQNLGTFSTLATGLDVYIYTDASGVPSSDPFSPGTGVLEIINLDIADPSLTINDDTASGSVDITIDVTAANGGDLVLSAGTYWLVVAPVMTMDDADGDERWNWFTAAAPTVLSEAHLIDNGVFGISTWTSFSGLGLTFFSTAFTISGTPNLSVGDENLSTVEVFPNPAKDVINIESVNELTNIELFSVLGKQVYKGTNERTIDISNLNTGVYLLKLSNDSGSVTKRIVKE
ncbi:T9SS type A sorting domain-containing protein [Ichthyenterobacterium sp. W332]|uniref:T9SS type A sorting domain-containing protein n=1 Tax=Microcosmobacter mediterraneus TaxID=3075607 RepID=A0ABU2YGK6_9FLAO|nr:T9SS type A sorting domain-containing protein [Ichthyenterobacterium sp. W332]MDT0557319.1 T9SS type A sorting domain-containing protein [Ichthyenterobacterium sp. W332]